MLTSFSDIERIETFKKVQVHIFEMTKKIRFHWGSQNLFPTSLWIFKNYQKVVLNNMIC